MADEIVCTDGIAEIGPTPRAPIVDKSAFAHIRHGALRLAYWRMHGKPKRRARARNVDVNGALANLADVFGRDKFAWVRG